MNAGHSTVRARRHRAGFLLLPVLLCLTLVATAAFLLTRQGTMAAQLATGQVEARAARYLAEAGFAHAYWQVQDAHCSAFDDVPSTAFSGGYYSARVDSTQATSTFLAAADQDTWLNEGNATANYGGDPELRVESDSGGSNNHRALYRFDLSSVPAGWRVSSATLHLTLNDIDEDAPVTLHRVTAGWTEAGATWANTASDFDPAVIGAIPVQVSSPARVKLTLTGLVQEWLDGTQPNDGVMLIATSDGETSELASREGSDSGAQPELEIVAAPANAPIRAAITATGTHGGDATRTLSHSDLPVYQSPGTKILQPTSSDGKDAFIVPTVPTANAGGANVLSMRGSLGWRSLLEFDLSAIAPGARVNQAVLALHVSALTVPGSVAAHRVRSAWTEGTCTSPVCIANGVTWLTRDGISGWTPGGDFDAEKAASAAVSTQGHWVLLDLTQLATGWVDGDFPNHGVLLTGNAGLDADFASSEHPSRSLAPILAVSYACECGVGGSSQTVVIQPGVGGEDTYLDDNKNLENYGADTRIRLTNQASRQKRALLRFDVSSIPSNAVIDDATLELNLEGIGSDNSGTVGVFRLTEDWVEGTGGGVGCWDGASWLERDGACGPWATPGSSFDPAVRAIAPIDWTQPGPVTWDLAGLVKEWVDGTHPNFGMLLIPSFDINHADFTTGDSPSPGLHPKLSVSWSCPCGVDCSGGPSGPVSGGNVLMVVVNPSSLTAQEAAKKALMESWGFTVNLIDVHDSQADFDLAVADHDVAFVTEDVNSGDLGTKLTDAPIGVVTEESNLADELGLGPDIVWSGGTDLEIVDVSHYITEVFAPGPLGVLSASESIATLTDWPAPSARWLGTLGAGGNLALAALEAGATMHTGDPAAGRRVMLPWGANDFDVASLTTDGLTVFRRSLEWGASTAPFTTSTRVEASNDDAEERADTSMYLTSSDLELTEESSNQTVGIRFASVGVPAGATIEGAFIEFTVDETSSWTTSLSFRGEAADDPGSFTSSSGDVSSRPATAESVDWNGLPVWNEVNRVWTSPDLASIVQALLDRPGWAAHQAMVFVVTGTGRRIAESYDGEPGSAPRLLIHYSGVAPPPPPLIDCVADDFETDDYTGSTGTLPWDGPWQEVGESNGPDSGDEQVVSWDGSRAVRVRDDDNGGEGVERGADISSFTTATLSFVYQRSGLDDSDDDFVRVRVSSNSGGSWTTIDTITEPPGTDSSWQTASYDVSAWISPDFMVRFRTSNDMGGSDAVYFDDVEICE